MEKEFPAILIFWRFCHLKITEPFWGACFFKVWISWKPSQFNCYDIFSHHFISLSVSQDFLEPQSRKQNREWRPWPVSQQQQDAPSSMARAPGKARCEGVLFPVVWACRRRFWWGWELPVSNCSFKVLFKVPQGPEVSCNALAATVRM